MRSISPPQFCSAPLIGIEREKRKAEEGESGTAGVRLLIATFIALPLLPDEPIEPWGALNPYSLWLLVILISSLSLVGYVLTRLLGSARGTALTGLTGGLVSSTAVTLSFAKEGRDNPQEAPALACGILLAWAFMFVRVIVLVAAANRSLLTHVIVPFAAMAVVVGELPRFSIFAAARWTAPPARAA